MLSICYGIKNSHEPNFFNSMIKYFSNKGYEQSVVARDYIEVHSLLEQLGIPYKSIGRHFGGNKLMKIFGLIANDLSIALRAPYFDVSISHSNTYIIHATKLRSKTAITFSDNDISFNLRTYNKFVDYLFTPDAIPWQKLIDRGCSPNTLIQYAGFKEDIYIADYVPDEKIRRKIPFNNYVTIRPESLQAHYIPRNTKSLVPELFKTFNEHDIKVLYLPRYKSDHEYAKGFENIYIPDKPLNGLDVCYYSDAVLTGAGTFAREAAILGTPAVSFFPRNELLAVDQKMVNDGWMFHSRDAGLITTYVLSSTKKRFDQSRCKSVQQQVFNSLDEILRRIAKTNKHYAASDSVEHLSTK